MVEVEGYVSQPILPNCRNSLHQVRQNIQISKIPSFFLINAKKIFLTYPKCALLKIKSQIHLGSSSFLFLLFTLELFRKPIKMSLLISIAYFNSQANFAPRIRGFLASYPPFHIPSSIPIDPIFLRPKMFQTY